MFFFFVCGEHTFRKDVKGYEGMICQCHHCGNMAGRVIKSYPFFTFCFIPIIPLSIKGHEDVTCSICNFHQPLEHRPDVQGMRNGAAGGAPQGQHPPPGPHNQQYQPQQHPQQGWKAPGGDQQARYG